MADHRHSAPLVSLLALALCATPGCLPAGLTRGDAFLDAVTCALWSTILGGLTAAVAHVVSTSRAAGRRHRAYRASACAAAEVLSTGSARCAFSCGATTEHWVWLRVEQAGPARAIPLPLELRITVPGRVLFQHAGTMRLDEDGFPEDWPLEPGTVGLAQQDRRLARFSARPGEEVVVELRYRPDAAVSLAALELWVAPTPPP